MLVIPDCIPCIRNMALRTIGGAAARRRSIKASIDAVMALPPPNDGRWNVTAPELIRKVWDVVVRCTGSTDPLAGEKTRQNTHMMNLLPDLKRRLERGDDPFEEAVALAVTANNIDAMLDRRALSAPETSGLQRRPHFRKGLRILGERLAKARSLVYLGDNCGEIIADKLLMGTIRDAFSVEIFFVVRSVPVMNDATLDDARLAGIGEVAQAMENGIRQPFPGTSLALVSPQLRQLIHRADLVISKGGGNYDVLSEERALDGKITYLLPAKCRPYAALHGVRRGSLLVLNA